MLRGTFIKGTGIDIAKHLLLDDVAKEPSKLLFDVTSYKAFRDRRFERMWEILAAAQAFSIAQEYVDVETAKQTGRAAFGKMVAYLKAHPAIRALLVERTDRLYRNLKDWVTVDELEVEIHFSKEGVVLSRESRSSDLE
jgi:Resolvase, N terminal domain